jgi:hypothetical protein
MHAKYFFMTALVILMLLVLFTQNTKEGFLQDYCAQYKSCTDCSSASGCSWCPKSNVCLTSTTLKSTDADCNQMNTIASSFRCPSAEGVEPPTLPAAIASDDVMYEFSLYKNRITDKIPPPNLYMAGDVKVSNQDLLSNMNDVRNDIANYKTEMPGIISSAVENQIKPMVKGVLAQNYYIQGFQDMSKSKNKLAMTAQPEPHTPGGWVMAPTFDCKLNPQSDPSCPGYISPSSSQKPAEPKCKKYNSCSSCTADSTCGWDPNTLTCDIRGPNKSWYITQPTRCVTTPATRGLMISQPN